MKRSLALLVLALWAAAANPAAAQSRNFTWWNNPVLVKELNLTPEQTSKIRGIVRSYRDRLFDARNSVQKAEAQLEDMLNDETVDPAATKPVIDRIVNGRANSLRLVTEMSVQLRTAITADQWRQLVRRSRELQKEKKLADTEVAQ
jgi:Spy/CpxP family protein refolding chaperone